MIAPVLALPGGGRLAGVAVQPVLDDVVVELLRPKQPAKAWRMTFRRVGGKILRESRVCVEFVGLANPFASKTASKSPPNDALTESVAES